MKVVIFGGSGFLGTGLVTQLLKDPANEITIISRHDKPDSQPKTVAWVKSDLLRDANWHQSVQAADWVIDCIGILLPNWKHHVTYRNGIFRPAQVIIDFLTILPIESRPKFMFISANRSPFFMAPYMHAKRQVEQLTTKLPAEQVKIVYPTVMYDRSRPYSVVMALGMGILTLIPGIKMLMRGFEPMKRSQATSEIVKLLHGEKSFIAARRK
ncbi:NAD-dependent epimerase/dehydratase family protein [Periweissella fabaria]|uniref:NAD-dependent epimerase/dehydratase domain-containing protein n=1 Tax=Periweissella fabaria TaxID=546157 RepID=A0ABM8Z4Y1_9LACO|nr:NAD-dependent epimerase/dehydratase family protein [Periweissella fabaria]MCM0596642.1 NAD-dependent epimerase/dehydratase family protein [Periweissella fabaria]CAH0416433.1 hypothetical protein WFA24289_00737 [Periweissella fabaria]